MKLVRLLFLLMIAAGFLPAQDTKLRVIAIGAHPDDCDIKFGGTAAKYAKLGHAVKFVAVTNGDAGHQDMGGGTLAMRRYKETQEAARRLGIGEYEVLDNHDGELAPTLEIRKQIIRSIRRWNADVVFAPRPNDYHPDHRYTGMLVQDAAYMVVVPNVAPDTPPLRKNPVFIYYQDRFQKPAPFRPDVAVDITDTRERKLDGLDAMVSQVYEWLPWVDGILNQVPKDPTARRRWLGTQWKDAVTPVVREALIKWYGPQKGAAIQFAEAFEVCEYGKQPSQDELRKLFPFF